MRNRSSLAVALLALLAPAAARADGTGPIATPHATLAPAPQAAERGACVGDGVVARVAALTGDVRAIDAAGAERALACDDALNACDTIVTRPVASASLLMDDALVQLGPETRAQVSLRPGPDVALEQGGVRVVDSRADPAQRVQLVTPALRASTGRGDAELVRDGAQTRACAFDEPLVVSAHDDAQTIPAGSCALAGGGNTATLTHVAAGAPSVALGDPASCPFHVAGVPALLPPVSAGPENPGVDPFEPPGRDSCDSPGSGCSAEPECEICEDPDPGTGCGFPGSPCP